MIRSVIRAACPAVAACLPACGQSTRPHVAERPLLPPAEVAALQAAPPPAPAATAGPPTPTDPNTVDFAAFPPSPAPTDSNAVIVEMARTGRVGGPPGTGVRTVDGRTELTAVTPDGAVTRIRSGGGRPQEVEQSRPPTWANLFGTGLGQ